MSSDLSFLAPNAVTKFIFGHATPAEGGRISSTPEQIQEAVLRKFDGGTSIYGAVSDGQAMRVAAVWACVRLLATAIAMLPVTVYRKDGEKNVIDATHDVHRLVSLRPNYWQSPFEFWQLAVAHVLLQGNFYAQKVRYRGRIVDLVHLDPRHVTPVLEPGRVVYRYREGDKSIDFKQDDIFHIRGLCTDGVRGLAVLEAARNTIGASVEMEKHGASMMQNGARPSGALYTDLELSDEAFERLRADFDKTYMGSNAAGKPLILESGLKWQQLSMNAADAQFIEQRKLTRNEIAMFFGVPPHMIGDIERGTSWGSGIEQQNLGFLVHTLMPYIVNIQQACLRDLILESDQPNFVVKFDTSLLTRADFVARQNGLQIMARNGVLSQNDWRKIEGFDPIEGEEADSYRVSGPGSSAAAGKGSDEAEQLGAGQGAGQ